MNYDESRTCGIAEAAKILGIGRNRAYAAARLGQIPTIRMGKRLVVPRAALDKMLSCETPAKSGA